MDSLSTLIIEQDGYDGLRMVYEDPCFSDCDCDGYADHGLGAVPDGYIQYFIRLGSMNRWMNKVLDKRRGSPIGDHWEMLSLQDSNIPKPGKELEEYLKDAHRRRVELEWRSYLNCVGGLAMCSRGNIIPAKVVHPKCTCHLEKLIVEGYDICENCEHCKHPQNKDLDKESEEESSAGRSQEDARRNVFLSPLAQATFRNANIFGELNILKGFLQGGGQG